jgi:HPt (histidine-containing phosphotransfer) domain-containing protein/CheY-like chemotaxis protein
MNSLRFLLVHRDPEQSEGIAARLAEANHTMVATSDLNEAADALTVERFDAVLMESVFRRPGLYKYGLQEFSALLRNMDQPERAGNRVPLIALDDGSGASDETCIDAVMPEPIDANALTQTVTQLARALSGTGKDPGYASSNGSLEVLDSEKFKEQVGFDRELLLEIIDLFLEERQRQEPEMRSALEIGEFDRLSRLAHTIKGSLASLHAMRARLHAQDLELAAKDCDKGGCWLALAALEADLAQLEHRLIDLRQSTT